MSVSVCLCLCVRVCVCLSAIISSELHVRSSPTFVRVTYGLLHGYTHGVEEMENPETRWTDDIRDDCMGIGISIQEASHIATDRERWRNTIRKVGC